MRRKARTLTAAEIRKAAAMWKAGNTESEIALAIGISIDVFRSRRHDQLAKLKSRRDGGANRGRRSVDVTPDDVRRRIEEVQSRWSDDERNERCVARPGEVLRKIAVAEIVAAYRNG